jgi:hypothetical protein
LDPAKWLTLGALGQCGENRPTGDRDQVRGLGNQGGLPQHMIGTLRRELLDRMLIVNERHLRRVLTVYLGHFNAARPHRSLGQLAPAQAETRAPEPVNLADYRIRRKPILNGLTSQYERAS